MKNKILTNSYKVVVISSFIIFFGIVTLFVALRITDYKIGFDLQNKACIGRVFIYKNIVANDYISNLYEIEHTKDMDFDYNNITSMWRQESKDIVERYCLEDPNANCKSYKNMKLFTRLGKIIGLKLKKDFYPFKNGDFLIKQIVALESNVIEIEKGKIIVKANKISDNTYEVIKVYDLDTNLYMLNPKLIKDKSYVLKKDEIFLVGQKEGSLDSRLLGPFHVKDIDIYPVVYKLF